MSNSEKPEDVRRRAWVEPSDCPMALAAEVLGDRWTLLILREAFYGVVRYDDMRTDLGAPRSMLTDRLARMVDRGLLRRMPYQEKGDRRRYGYALTDKGRALAPVLVAMTQWGEAHVLGRPAPVSVVDKTTGEAVRAELVRPGGQAVKVGDLRMVPRKG